MKSQLFVLFLIIFVELTYQSRSPKKGIVIPSWPRHFAFDFDSFSTISWWYNYLPVPEAEYHNKWWCLYSNGVRPEGEARSHCFPSDPEVEFVPMIFGGGRNFGDVGFCNEQACGLTVPPEYQTILGFNEPNQPDQSNMTPMEAAVKWMEMQELYPNRTLVSPATGHADTEWFDEFWLQCEILGCRIDYLATHWYKSTQGAELTINTLRDYSERYGGLKIWFTEFAAYREHDEEKVIQYIEELLPLLEHSDFIHRYSWFISRYYEDYDESGWFWIDPINSLLKFNSSQLSNVGRAYNKPYHMDMYKPKNL